MSKTTTYDENVKIWKDEYSKILEVCDKYLEFSREYGFDDIRDMRTSALNHLLLIEWYEKYGIKLIHDRDSRPAQYTWFKYNEYCNFNKFGDAEGDKESGSGKFISWSDDGRQPKDEWLFCISFPTGAYIFGRDYDYQQPLFREFFDELKSFQPDFSDSHNSCLYWKLENTRDVFDSFNTILRKYQDKNRGELKKRQADKLRKELEKLEAES